MAFRDVLDVGHFSSAFLQAVNVQLWQAGKKLLLNKCSSILVSNKKKKKKSFIKEGERGKINYAFLII